jgi:pimeloyl-ACP methyl ester carboxylesterase
MRCVVSLPSVDPLASETITGWSLPVKKAVLIAAQVATLVAVLGIALAGCASTTPALEGSKDVTLHGQRISVARSGAGSPVVVLEAGLASSKETWAKVASDLAKAHVVFAYDRPGQGASEPTQRPRTGQQIVQDLRALLQAQELPPPYVLVGHSMGGLYMQLYARSYPEEVAALVLVDSTHPLNFAGAGALENRSMLSRAAIVIGVRGNAGEEFSNVNATGQSVLSAPPLAADMPVVVLIAPQAMQAQDPEQFAMSQRDNDLRRDFARMYPHAHIVDTQSGHMVQVEKPALVVQAIEEVIVKAAKKVAQKP